MANIVGLGSMQDPISAGQRRLRDSAKLADGLDVVRPVQLRPVAQPVETYARPAQAPINHDLENLAQGLSSLNGALTRFAGMSAKEDKEVDKDKVVMALNGKSPDEINQMLTSGNHPVLSKQVNAQYAGQLAAQRQADLDSQFLLNHYNTSFDKQNGDWDKEVKEFYAKRVQQYGNNPGFANAYTEQMVGFSRSSMQTFLKDKAEQAQFQATQQTQDGVVSVIRNAVNTDAPPERLVNDLSVFMRNNKDIARQQYGDQSKMFVDGLRPLIADMDQRPQDRDKIFNALNTVLTAPRKGEDGVERRLIDAPNGVGQAYQGLLADAAKKRDDLNSRYLTGEKTKFDFNAEHDPSSFTDKQLDEWNAANGFTLSPGQVESLKLKRANSLRRLEEKRLDNEAEERARTARVEVTGQDLRDLENLNFRPETTEVPDKDFYRNGNTAAVKKFTADERTQAVADAYSKKLQVQEDMLVSTGKMTKEQAAQWRSGQELATYSQNMMVPQGWKDEMNAGINGLTTAAQTASKEMPERTVAAYERYKLLKAQAPNLVDKVADERTRAVFDAAMASGAASTTDQLRVGVQYYANRDEKRDAVTDKKVNEALDNLKPGFWKRNLGGLFGDEPPENMEALRGPITQRARIMMQTQHIDAETAIAASAKALRSSYAVVNGKVIPTNDQRLPPQFDKLATDYLRDLVSEYGAARFGARSAEDLSLEPLPDGGFQVINKHHQYMSEGPAPITWKDGTNRDARFLSPDMIQDLAVQERQKAELRAVRSNAQSQEAQKNRLQPLFVIPGAGVGIPKPSAGLLDRKEAMEVQANARKIEGERQAASSAKAGQNRSFVETVNRNAETARQELENPTKPTTPLTVGRGIRIR